MIFHYNGTDFDQDSCGLAIRYRIIRDQFQQKLAQLEEWVVGGLLRGSGQAAVSAEIATLESVFSSDGGDLILKTDAGVPTQHYTPASLTFGGPRIVELKYPTSPYDQRAEFATYRTWLAVIHAERRFNQGIIGFKERITRIGDGGIDWVFSPAFNATPEMHDLQDQTPIMYIQEGYVIGDQAQPAAPTPLGYGRVKGKLSRVGVQSAEEIRVDGGARVFRVDYRYVMGRTGIYTGWPFTSPPY